MLHLTPLRRHARYFSGWVACCVLLMALAPALGQLLGALRGEPSSWSQICRSSVVSPRAQQSVLAARQAADKDSLHGLFHHCPACDLQAQQAAAPPPNPQALPLLNALRQAMPVRFFSAPQSMHAWAPPQSRAPPALSLA